MMKAVQIPGVGSRTSEGFAGRKPLVELMDKVPEPDLHYVFNSISRKRGVELHTRFYKAREALADEFGARIEIVQAQAGGLRVSAKYEFYTTDRTLDENLDDLVRIAGFSLILRTRPMLELAPEDRYEHTGRYVTNEIMLSSGDNISGVWIKRTPVFEEKMERIYLIKEREHASADLHRATDSAEALYQLLKWKLKLPMLHQDLPDNVIPISSRMKPEPKSGVVEKLDPTDSPKVNAS